MENEERISYPGVSPLKELTWITAPGADAVADESSFTKADKGKGKGKKGKGVKGKGKNKAGKGKGKGSKSPSKDAAKSRGGRTVSLE